MIKTESEYAAALARVEGSFADNGWDDYPYWCSHDSDPLERLNGVIGSSRRTPFAGIGKPEPLRGGLAGFRSPHHG